MLNPELLKQHIIDPEICIRCNTCEATCPIQAITHDSQNYVVDAEKCNFCMACISPCPTGSIDNWRTVLKSKPYTLEEQLSWEEMPLESSPEQLGVTAGIANDASSEVADHLAATQSTASSLASAQHATSVNPVASLSASIGSQLPPWSAAHAYVNLYAAKNPITATVVGNVRVTEVGRENDTHHIVLDFGVMPFPVLEGQSIGVLPPGVDERGKPHHARQYSIASPRNGERPGYNNISLTVKRVLENHQGQAVMGVASNYLCDLNVGDTVQVIGPFGASFLMPNHPKSHILMICTGTGSAPMRAMTEWRRRLRASGKFEGGKLMLFFGARTAQELPYFGPLQNLPKDFIDTNFAFSRAPNTPKRYVQDAIRDRATDVAALIKDPNSYIYVCGLKAMEEGVLLALKEVVTQNGQDWEKLAESLKIQGRLHLETY